MQYLQMRKQIGELLTDLGRTSGEVAMKLTSTGVQGIPKDVHGCAVARYLSAILGTEARIHSVRVDTTRVRVLVGRSRIPISIRLSEPIRTFIQAFDQNLYPDLVRARYENQSQVSC